MAAEDLWTEALAEAYSAAPESAVILPTIELTHSTFTDDEGNPIAIRMVRDPGELLEMSDTDADIRGHRLTLEDDALFEPGENVIFQSVMFDFNLPEQSDSKVSGMSISFDNVTRIIAPYLDKAVKERSPMQLVYREYLADDPSTPQLVIRNLSIKRVASDIYKVQADADFMNFINKKFPNREYRPDEYPGLAQS